MLEVGVEVPPFVREGGFEGQEYGMFSWVRSRECGVYIAPLFGLAAVLRLSSNGGFDMSGCLRTRLSMGDVRAPRGPVGMGLALKGGSGETALSPCATPIHLITILLLFSFAFSIFGFRKFITL
jgi:hypothetical protein